MRIDPLPTLFRAAAWRLRLLHAAPVLRIFWLTSGQARCILGTRMRGTGVHSLLVVPAGAPFALEPGAALAGHMLSVPDTAGAAWPETALLIRVRDTFLQSEMTGFLDAIQREQTAARPLYETAMAAYAPLLSVWLHRFMESDAFEPPPETAADLICAAFLADLEARYMAGDTMAGFAARLGITPTHLARVCKAQLGASAAEVSAARVLWAARDLLETTPLPAKSIAAGLGFGSGASFTRFIQAQTGVSPRALRAAAAQKPGAR